MLPVKDKKVCERVSPTLNRRKVTKYITLMKINPLASYGL
jgi:hypothetical protein